MANWMDKLRGLVKPWTTGTEPMELRRAVLDDVESRVVTAGGGKRVFPYNRLEVRLLADSPEAENPGALTLAEYLANPDSASGNNIRRAADKDVQQYQLSLVMNSGRATGKTQCQILLDAVNAARTAG